jgi:hypothetical protein
MTMRLCNNAPCPSGEGLMLPGYTRTRALSVLLALFVIATGVHGQQPKQMAITFDDLPFGYARGLTITGSAKPSPACWRPSINTV